MTKPLVAILAVFGLAQTTTATAQVVISTAFGNGADAYLTNDDQQGPTTATGTQTGMTLYYNGVNRAKILYFRFDISQVTGDLSGATITLNATSNNRSRTNTIFALADSPTEGGAGNNWLESAITYDTASGVDPLSALNTITLNLDFTAVATLAYVQGAPGDYTSTTGTISDFLAADTDGIVTFAFGRITTDASDLSAFQTKEAGNNLEPRLNLPNATLVPEPGTIALFLAGAGFLVLVRRRSRA